MRATEYAKKLAIDIAYNQHMFHGKRDYWFQVQCEKLGYDISENLARRWRIVLFVVCVDPKLINKSTKNIPKNWSSHRQKVTEAFKSVIKKAQESNEILYPLTFKLFKTLFPTSL